MALSREVILHVFRTASSATEAADALLRLETIRDKVIERSRKIALMKSQTDSAIRKMMEQVLCKHDVRSTHGDPSGGSDSYEECLICGEAIVRKSVRFT